MISTAQDLRTFLSVAARRPSVIGAIAPSSRTLADRLTAVVPRSGSPTVVELGPGTGVVSSAIAQRLPARGRQVCVEIDSRLVSYLHRTRPELDVILGDAVDLRELLVGRGIERADAVVSGIPWALLRAERQERILAEVGALLDPDGVFTTFAYLHALPSRAARTFRGLLQSRFDEVLPTRSVWRNAPPAITYVCRRAVRDANNG
jgi:phospholipid N-methyltransferase